MPDKRQESKQRQAARNRARREALAARRENAEVSDTTASSSSSSSKASSAKGGTAKGASANGTATSAAASGPPPRGVMGMLQSKRPGDKAVLAAFALAVVAAIYLLFYKVPADDRGEPLPSTFRGLAIAARERLTGQNIGDDQVSLLDASGPQIFLVLALPIAVTVFALWANRRPDRSRMLTFAMLAMAGSVILTGGIGIFFFPALIALAIGGFRVRRADMPARVAERATARGRGGRGREDAIDVESDEVVDDAAEDDVSEPTPARPRRRFWGAAAAERVTDAEPDDADEADATEAAGATDVDPGEADPLAELEAELEAERAAEADANDGDGPDDSGWSRRGK